MTLEVEGVVGDGMHRDEALSVSRRLEALHITFSLADMLVGDLSPIVPAIPLLMVGPRRANTMVSPETVRFTAAEAGCRPCGELLV